MTWHRGVVAGLLALSVTACSTDAVVAPAANAPMGVAEDLASAVAFALMEPEVRMGVRDAMRASRLVEHKLELRSFVATPEGQRLVSAIARAKAATSEEVLALIQQLPPMDFYVPRKQDRLTWRGGTNYVVAITLDNNVQPAKAYTRSGRPGRFGRTMPEVILALEPSEPKFLRVNPQPETPGDVIQDATDGEDGGAISRYDNSGRLLWRVEFAQLFRGRAKIGPGIMMDCAPEEIYCDPESGGGGGSAPADTVFLDYFWTEHQDGIGSLEMVFKTWLYDSSNQQIGYLQVEKGNVSSETDYYWHMPLIYHRPVDFSGQYLHLHLYEDDQFSDDDMGYRSFFAPGDNDATRTVEADNQITNVRLKWTPKT